MKDIIKKLTHKCSKYVFEYLDTKQPFIAELINKTVMLRDDTNRYIFNENNHYDIINNYRYKYKTKITQNYLGSWFVIATRLTE